MSVTEHLLTCIKNQVLSEVAKSGGGLDKMDIYRDNPSEFFFFYFFEADFYVC